MDGTRARRRLRRLPFGCLLGVALMATAAFGRETGKEFPRMYAGYPPLIPHDVRTMTGGQCLECHGTGMGGAPIAPHPSRTHFCLQCHVPQDPAAKPFPPGRGN
ncbi:MAG TPA: nitrate reductase cytochrome c-type subunit [Candidatus Methylomirabilis sp.]|jgi:nitrate reductase cytochrome c-type subunit